MMDRVRLAEEGEFPSSSGEAQPEAPGTNVPPAPITNQPDGSGNTPAGNDQPTAQQPQQQPTTTESGFMGNTPGWESIAAKQNAVYNAKLCRKFEDYFWQSVLDFEVKIEGLGRLLREENKKDKAAGCDERLKGLIFDYERLIWGNSLAESSGSRQRHVGPSPSHSASHVQDHAEPSGSRQHTVNPGTPAVDTTTHPTIHTQDRKDKIKEALTSKLKEYYEFVAAGDKIMKMAKVSRGDSNSFLNWIQGDLSMDPDARAVFYPRKAHRDFVSLKSGVHSPFESIIYSESRSFLQELLHDVFKDRNTSLDGFNNNGERAFRTGLFDAATKTFLGLCCIGLLMAPLAVLFLVPMSKAQSLAVVFCFGSLFMFVLGLASVPMDTMLLGFSAYVAVMATFMANLR